MAVYLLFVSVWGFLVFPSVSYTCNGLKCWFFNKVSGVRYGEEVIQSCLKDQVSVSLALSVAHLSLPGSVEQAVSLYDSLASFSYPWA